MLIIDRLSGLPSQNVYGSRWMPFSHSCRFLSQFPRLISDSTGSRSIHEASSVCSPDGEWAEEAPGNR